MTALAMILTAAMMVPGDGPEKVSGEVVRSTLPLNLKGKWNAVVHLRGRVIKGEASLVRGRLQIASPGSNQIDGLTLAELSCDLDELSDEGNGKLQTARKLGIYEQDGNLLRICVGTHSDKSRPASFLATEKQCLLILHRVNSRK